MTPSPSPHPPPTCQDSEAVTALALSPDNKTLIVASRSLFVRVYDITTGAQLRNWRGHKGPVADLAIDASGGYVATASADRTVKVATAHA